MSGSSAISIYKHSSTLHEPRGGRRATSRCLCRSERNRTLHVVRNPDTEISQQGGCHLKRGDLRVVQLRIAPLRVVNQETPLRDVVRTTTRPIGDLHVFKTE